MGIGADIKAVFQDVGTGITIVRDSGHVSGEYIDFTLNRQVTKPFIREHFLEASLAHDTVAVTGDVLRFNTTEDNYLLVNKTPEMFEDGVITYESVLYKCNITGGVLLRPSGEVRDAHYHKQTQWDTVKSDVHALQTEALYGTDLLTDEELGRLSIENDELYIPTSVGVTVLDRWEPVSGEFYMVMSIKKRRYDAVDICMVEEDTR